MEALNSLKFWLNAIPSTDSTSKITDIHKQAFETDEDDTDDDDSFFDLVLNSPDNKSSNGKFQFIESPRDVFMTKIDSSNSKPMSPATLLRSAPKFNVFMLGFKRPAKTESITELKASPLSQIGLSNRYESRDNSLRSKMLKEISDDTVLIEKSVPKYMKLIKPFYVKTLKKAKVTDLPTPSSSPVNLHFSEGRKSRNLGKSRSASAVAPQLLRRRDDSLLDDGIQGAILHCKKSYSGESQTELSRKSCEEQKRCSI